MDSSSIKKLNNFILKDEKNINKENLQKFFKKKTTTTKRMSIKFERKNPKNDKNFKTKLKMIQNKINNN
jgi:hypothetical protein